MRIHGGYELRAASKQTLGWLEARSLELEPERSWGEWPLQKMPDNYLTIRL